MMLFTPLLAFGVIVLLAILLLRLVGPTYGGTGTTPPSVRYGRTGEQTVSQCHGKYYEGASRGVMFAGHTSAGRTPGTALGTAPGIALYNPVGSNTLISIKKVSVAQAATGTLGTGTLSHCVFTLNGGVGAQTAIPTGTAITPRNCYVGGAPASVASLLEAVTLQANPVLLYPAIALSESVGGTTTTTNVPANEDVDGAIVLPPGAGWCLEALAAAGSSPLVQVGVVWEEIPLI